jgi:hypothetical protein
MNFNMDEYEVKVIRTFDQYNDYSVAFDVTLQIKDLDKIWTQVITASGDDLPSIKRAFKNALEQGWIRPN